MSRARFVELAKLTLVASGLIVAALVGSSLAASAWIGRGSADGGAAVRAEDGAEPGPWRGGVRPQTDEGRARAEEPR